MVDPVTALLQGAVVHERGRPGHRAGPAERGEKAQARKHRWQCGRRQQCGQRQCGWRHDRRHLASGRGEEAAEGKATTGSEASGESQGGGSCQGDPGYVAQGTSGCGGSGGVGSARSWGGGVGEKCYSVCFLDPQSVRPRHDSGNCAKASAELWRDGSSQIIAFGCSANLTDATARPLGGPVLPAASAGRCTDTALSCGGHPDTSQH